MVSPPSLLASFSTAISPSCLTAVKTISELLPTRGSRKDACHACLTDCWARLLVRGGQQRQDVVRGLAPPRTSMTSPACGSCFGFLLQDKLYTRWFPS
jgi:hypothetical protein